MQNSGEWSLVDPDPDTRIGCSWSRKLSGEEFLNTDPFAVRGLKTGGRTGHGRPRPEPDVSSALPAFVVI